MLGAVAMAGDAVAEVASDAFFGMLARHALRRMLVTTRAGVGREPLPDMAGLAGDGMRTFQREILRVVERGVACRARRGEVPDMAGRAIIERSAVCKARSASNVASASAALRPSRPDSLRVIVAGADTVHLLAPATIGCGAPQVDK
jgi:hypothetical protein